MASIILEASNNSKQTIKFQVQPNEVLRDLLKKFCDNFKLNFEDYGLFYKNKELDLGLQFRFSNILQNSRIQVKKTKKTNGDNITEVNIGIQFDGGRYTHKFKTNTTIWDILLFAEKEKNVKLLHRDYTKKNDSTKYYLQTVVHYMTNVINTNKELRKTTLYSLSIRSGSGLLRLSFKETNIPYDEFIEQDQKEIEIEQQEKDSVDKMEVESNTEPEDNLEVELDERSRILREQIMKEEENDRLRIQKEIEEELRKEQERERKRIIEENVKKQKKIEKLTITNESEDETKENNDPFLKEVLTKGGILDKKVAEVHEILRTIDTKEIDTIPSEPCPRDIKIFKPNESEFKPSNIELPDDFFEPTSEDFSFKKDNKEEILKTSHMRRKEYLMRISKYKKCFIRIKFPDNYSIQGTFYPQETTEHVINFVKENIIDPTIDFYLYTTPPIEPLHMNKSLRDQNLVPAAQVYFGIKGGVQVLPSPLLKLEGVEVVERVYNDNEESSTTVNETNKKERRKPKSKSEKEEIEKKILSKMFGIKK